MRVYILEITINKKEAIFETYSMASSTSPNLLPEASYRLTDVLEEGGEGGHVGGPQPGGFTAAPPSVGGRGHQENGGRAARGGPPLTPGGWGADRVPPPPTAKARPQRVIHAGVELGKVA